MAGKTKALKPDTILKNYWNDPARFADLFNAVLFDGNPVIRPEELEDAAADESSILEHREYAQSIQAARDLLKARKKLRSCGVELVLLGNESQEHIHYAMPLRVMGYDYGTYKIQYDSNARKYSSAKGLTPDEYLSKMKKTDRFTPVITVVVYYGETPWDGALSLHKMLQIPKELAAFINDYKLLLVEARLNRFHFHHTDNIDLFNLLEIILNTRACLKNAFREMCFTVCGEFIPNLGGIAGYVD